jgi:hypothetical protein
MMGKKVLLAVPVLMFLLFLSAGPAAAIEGAGLHQYPDGIDDFMMGALPPPGVYFLNYAVYVNISDFKDVRFPDGVRAKAEGLKPIKFKGWTMIDALRLIYVSKCKLLGGDLTFHAIQPIQHLEVTKFTALGGALNALDLVGPNNMTTGLKNTVVGAATGWHFSKNLHAVAILDIVMPTGGYTADDFANAGSPYWTFTPMFGVSYVTDSGLEASAKLMYDINTKNKETGYLSGQEFHADYLVGQHMGPWMFGLNGYYIHQITKDKVGDRADDTAGSGYNFSGALTRAFSTGPAVAYNYKNMFFKAKAQFDLYSVNRPVTQRYWFNFIYCF